MEKTRAQLLGEQFIDSMLDPNGSWTQYGLTKRQYFAGIAMQGLLTRVPKRESGEVALGVNESKRIVEESVIIADMLLEELVKEK
jgi:hypothetical protein